MVKRRPALQRPPLTPVGYPLLWSAQPTPPVSRSALRRTPWRHHGARAVGAAGVSAGHSPRPFAATWPTHRRVAVSRRHAHLACLSLRPVRRGTSRHLCARAIGGCAPAPRPVLWRQLPTAAQVRAGRAHPRTGGCLSGAPVRGHCCARVYLGGSRLPGRSATCGATAAISNCRSPAHAVAVAPLSPAARPGHALPPMRSPSTCWWNSAVISHPPPAQHPVGAALA